MHFLAPTITALLALASVAQVSSEVVWNSTLQVWNIGTVGKDPKDNDRNFVPAKWAGTCNVDNDIIRNGVYGCADGGSGNLQIIYKCEKGWLRVRGICSGNERCVKNQRRKDKKFFPLEGANELACVDKERAEASWESWRCMSR